MGRRHLALIVLFAAGAASAQDGSVRGKVQVQTLQLDGSTVPKASSQGVVVYIADFEQPPQSKSWPMNQQDRAFVPLILAIQTGDSVDFVNDDPFPHNVFSNSPARPFDVGKSPSQSKRSIKFSTPGVVDVFCDIHEAMKATILVLKNHAYARTAPDGAFVLEPVPAGKHTVLAWSGHGAPARLPVQVEAGKAAVVAITIEEPATENISEHADAHAQSYKKRGGSYGGAH